MGLIIGMSLLAGCSSSVRYIKQEEFSEKDLAEGVAVAEENLTTEFPDAASAPPAEQFVIGPFDTIRLKLYGLADFSGEMKVQADGTAFFPFIGVQQAAGYTVSDLRGDLERKFSEYLKSPQVDIEMAEVASSRFFLLGQVRQPGAFSLTRPVSVVEAVSMGRGPTEFGNLGTSYLIRGGRVYDLDLAGLLRGGDFRSNVLLQNNDIIYVPDNRESVVYVFGKVKKPSTLTLDRPMTAFDAIVACGGFEPGALTEEVKLIRGGLRTPSVYSINIEAIMDDGRYDVLRNLMLSPGDIVFVPYTALATWNEYIEQLNPTLRTFIYNPLSGIINYLTFERIMEER